MGRERIENTFLKLQQKKEKALITYVTAGDPDLASTVELVRELAKAGADLIELGVPFSDPVADGPVIQKASQRALEAGTSLTKIMEMVGRIRNDIEVPLVLMTYLNPVYHMGVENFCRQAAEAGVDGIIIPDLPMEEFSIITAPLRKAGLAFIPLIAPTTPAERMSLICREGSGFVYGVSLTGVTGARSELPEGVGEFLETLRQSTSLPVAVGFGVSRPDQAVQLKEHCDGVIVGSALVKIIESSSGREEMKGKAAAFTGGMKNALR